MGKGQPDDLRTAGRNDGAFGRWRRLILQELERPLNELLVILKNSAMTRGSNVGDREAQIREAAREVS